jgi:hypothetical protein
MSESERAFRLAVWSAVLMIVRALGKYWGMADNVKVIKSEKTEYIPVNPHGSDVAGITGYK